MTDTHDAIARQRAYYERTAHDYERLHMASDDEHVFALTFLSGMINLLGIRSILDVGSGTGRVLQHFHRTCPDLRVHGIEPVEALREVAYRQGVARDRLVAGDATNIAHEDASFDLVCEFGVLHHIPRPRRAVNEMLRVSSKAIFISDCNKFGQGSGMMRALKALLRVTRLWPLADFIKTRGKGYTESESDGIAFSYSVFDDYDTIAAHCSRVHVLNTQGDGRRALGAAGHVALLGIKR